MNTKYNMKTLNFILSTILNLFDDFNVRCYLNPLNYDHGEMRNTEMISINYKELIIIKYKYNLRTKGINYI